MKVLVTGGLGFIGSGFVHYLLDKYPEDKITIYDALTYAGRMENIKDIKDKVEIINADILEPENISKAVKDSEIVYHFAAESHVDRSIYDAIPFIRTNVEGTYYVLEAVRKHKPEKCIHISTSEVYGTALTDPMTEDHPLNPMSPYAASKAGGDRLAYSYYTTYKIPLTIVRPFNNYGPRQFPEKLIPLFITNALRDKPLPVYGKGLFTRDWLYVFDCCEALDKIRNADVAGETINLGADNEMSVIDITKMILKELGKPDSLIKYVEDRLGHVPRHIGSNDKAGKLLGWKPKTKFAEGLKQTISWYKENEWWWKPLVK